MAGEKGKFPFKLKGYLTRATPWWNLKMRVQLPDLP
jgi:hypothetical protein